MSEHAKVKIQTTVKVIKCASREPRRYNPMLDALNHQFSALMMMVRHIKSDTSYTVPPIVERLYDEFGKKEA